PTGGLYVRDPDRLRVAAPSYFSQRLYEPDGSFVPSDGARRFDQNWIPAASAPDWRFERSREMSERCRERLVEAGHDVVTERGHASLVSWRWEEDTNEIVQRLYEEGVVVRDLPNTGLLRASCGYWTNEEDIDRLVTGLAA